MLLQKIERLRKADERLQKAVVELNAARINTLAAADDVEDEIKKERE